MEYNKYQFRKANDKKVLRKIGKQWKTVSIALLMAIGGTAAVTHVSHASADTSNNQNSNTRQFADNQNHYQQAALVNEPKVNVTNTSNNSQQSSQNEYQNIAQQADNLHENILRNNINRNLQAHSANQSETSEFQGNYSNIRNASNQNRGSNVNKSILKTSQNTSQNNSHIINGTWGPMKNAAKFQYNASTNNLSINNGVIYDNIMTKPAGQFADHEDPYDPIFHYNLKDIMKAYNIDPYYIKSVDLNNISFSSKMPNSSPYNSINSGLLSNMDRLQSVSLDNVKLPSNAGFFFAWDNNLKHVSLKDIDSSQVSSMNSMFYDNTNLSDVEGLGDIKTPQLSDTEGMFQSDTNLKYLDMSNFDMSKVRNTSLMFSSDINLGTIRGLGSWNISNDRNASYMFYSQNLNWTASDVNNIKNNWVFPTQINDFDIYSSHNNYYCSLVNPTYRYSDGYYGFIKQEPKFINTDVIYRNWLNNENLGSAKNIRINPASAGSVKLPNNYKLAFIYNDKKFNPLQSESNHFVVNIIPDNDIYCGKWGTAKYVIDNHNTLSVANGTIKGRFSSDTSINTSNSEKQLEIPIPGVKGAFRPVSVAPVPLKSIQFQNVSLPQNASNLFSELPDLQGFNSKGLNVSDVSTMSDMFADDPNLQYADLNSFHTSDVNDMDNMFAGDPRLDNLDLSNFNTAKVSDMQGMFSNDPNLKSLDISNFNTQNVDNMGYMFWRDNSLDHIKIGNQTQIYNKVIGDSNFYNPSIPGYWVNTDNINKIVDLNNNVNPVAGTYYQVSKNAMKYPKAMITYKFGSHVVGVSYIPVFSQNHQKQINTSDLPDFPGAPYVLDSNNPKSITIKDGNNYSVSLDKTGQWGTATTVFTPDGHLEVKNGWINNKAVGLQVDKSSDNNGTMYQKIRYPTGVFVALERMGVDFNQVKSVSFQNVHAKTSLYNAINYKRGVNAEGLFETYYPTQMINGHKYILNSDDNEVSFDDKCYLPNLAKIDLTGLTFSDNIANYSDFITGLPSLKEVDLNGQTSPMSMNSMFDHDPELKTIKGLSDLDAQYLSDASYMFRSDYNISDVSGLADWNTINLSEYIGMFQDDKSLKDVSPIINNWICGRWPDDTEMLSGTSVPEKVRGVNGSPEIYPLGGWYMFSSHFAPFKEKHDVVDYETSDGNSIGSYTFSGSGRQSFLIGKHPKGLPKNYQVKDPNTRIHYCGIKHTVIVVSSNSKRTNNNNLYSSIYHDYYIADQDRKAVMTDVDNKTRYADPGVLSGISTDGRHVVSEELDTKNDLLKNDQSALNDANQQVSLTNSAANDASSLYSDAKGFASAKGTDIYNKSYDAYYDASATSHDASTALIKDNASAAAQLGHDTSVINSARSAINTEYVIYNVSSASTEDSVARSAFHDASSLYNSMNSVNNANQHKIYGAYEDIIYAASATDVLAKSSGVVADASLSTDVAKDIGVQSSAMSTIKQDLSANTSSALSNANMLDKSAHSAWTNANNVIYRTNSSRAANYHSIGNADQDVIYAASATNDLAESSGVVANTALSADVAKDIRVQSSALSAVGHDLSINTSSALSNANAADISAHSAWTDANNVIYRANSAQASANYHSIGNTDQDVIYAASATNALAKSSDVADNASLSADVAKDISVQSSAMSAIEQDLSANTSSALNNANAADQSAHSAWTNANNVIYSMNNSRATNYHNICKANQDVIYAASATNALAKSNGVADNIPLSAAVAKDISVQSSAISAISHDLSINTSSALSDANVADQSAHSAWTDANNIVYSINNQVETLKTVYQVRYNTADGKSVGNQTVHSVGDAKQFVPFGYSFKKIMSSSVKNGVNLLTVEVTPNF